MKFYFDNPDAPVLEREEKIISECNGATVLHLGCTDWPLTQLRLEQDNLLHEKISKVAARAVGVDLDQEGVDYLTRIQYPDIYFDNVENFNLLKSKKIEFDLIIAGEIIEHLDNPGLFLKSVQEIMTEKTKLIITTINAFCLFRFMRFIFGREMVHDDHCYYYSPRVLRHLIERNGLQVTGMSYYRMNQEARKKVGYHYLFLDFLATHIFPATSEGLIFEISKRKD